MVAKVRGAIEKRGIGLGWLRYLARPVFLGLVCLALYLWVSGLDLDSIEQRLLNLGNITSLLLEHVVLTVAATLVVVPLAVSAGILLTRRFAQRIEPAVVSVANIGQAVPSIGVIVLAVIFLNALGLVPALIALVAYAFLPVLRNTMVGLRQVDQFVVESARGMGMSKTAVLFRIELPLAIPIMLAGIRTALIITVGTATLVAFVAAGGLGQLIIVGINLGRDSILVTGAVLTAVLALFVDWLAGIAEEILRPKGL